MIFHLYDFLLSLFVALASSHVVLVMFVPMFAHEAVFSEAERVFARLGVLCLPILGHWHRITLPRTLEVL